MKDKNIIFTVETDVTQIECDLVNAAVSVEEAADGIFKIEYPNAKNVHIGSGENGLFLSQKKKLFGGKQQFKIYVPAHIIPAVKLNGKCFDFSVCGGIFGELNLNADCGNMNLKDCVFESVDVNGGEMNACLGGSTVKGNLNLQLAKGDVLAENTFATRTVLRVKRGNLGLVNLTCKDCTFETEKGNVTATMKGCEEDFSTSLLSKEGTVNRESVKRDGAENVFTAYTQKGNVVLDFIDGKENE
ncbi:MAG: DUF4097 domain-containing protein [Clostridia bacterium]|nr:DUF4097 domain-containing protein [Clostridia bacterium]